MGRRPMLKRNYDNEGNLISKECSVCHEIKPVSEFSKQKGNKDGIRSKCKECDKQHNKQYYENNAEKIRQQHKQYREDNAEKIRDYQKQYNKDNAEKVRQRVKQYHENNAEKIREYQKQYNKDNAEKVRERRRQYNKDNAEKHKEYKKQHYNKQIQEALQQIKTEVEKEPGKYNYIEGKEIYGVIYLVCNIKSDRYYVGQTTVGFDNRYNKGWLHDHDYKDTVKEDLTLYGEESFEYIKLFKVAYSQYELDKLEAYYIDYYDSYENGYNENRGNIFTDRGKEI